MAPALYSYWRCAHATQEAICRGKPGFLRKGEGRVMEEKGRISALYRYPVKGLSPERLERAELERGGTMPWDRAFAIENGTADFDAANPKHFPKIKFLMLMRHERLAALKTRFEDEGAVLCVEENGAEALRASLLSDEGRTEAERFFASYMKDELRGAPRIVHAPGFTHSDAPAPLISIINMASVRALEEEIGRPVDPLRFRGNVYLEGLEPWEDHDWVERGIALGGVGLNVVARTERCAATNVDPETAARDMEIPATLLRRFGHSDLGIYAHVKTPGALAPGDSIMLG